MVGTDERRDCVEKSERGSDLTLVPPDTLFPPIASLIMYRAVLNKIFHRYKMAIAIGSNSD
jgi:hypothetical protein